VNDRGPGMSPERREQILARYREYAARFDGAVTSRAGSRGNLAPPPVKTAARPSSRQLEILQLIADGNANDEIAAKLVVSVETVKTHIRQLLAKLGASNRAHAVALGLRSGIVS
jgi:DNA-binding NarL/FixJ family response regulator